jgi:hypothetical protein
MNVCPAIPGAAVGRDMLKKRLCPGPLTMSEATDKETLLEGAGYRYHFDRMIYFNREVRKAFSHEFVEDHSIDEIQHSLNAPGAEDNWTFYFNEPPSEYVRRELSSALEQ